MRKLAKIIGFIGGLVFAISVAAHFLLAYVDVPSWSPERAIEKAKNYKAEIIRDDYGVPHIYGKRDRDVAFGLAYAHAEDDFQTMQELIPFYRGELGRKVGKDGIVIDFLVNWLQIQETVTTNYERDLSPSIRAHLEAYTDGVNLFAALHPDEVEAGLFPLTQRDIANGFVLQHLLFYGFEKHVTDLFEDAQKYELATDPISSPITRLIGSRGLPVGSNAFAIAPSKSAEAATRIFINSHQPLNGPVAWYEAHVKSEEGWDAHGGLFPGMPFISKGFNNDIGWGVTVNKPDLVDVYKLTINPNDENEYLLDGVYQKFETRKVWLKLKIIGNIFIPIPRELLSSEHGPAIRTDHGVYAMRFAGLTEMRQPEQWLAINKAHNLDEFRDAMKMQAIVSFNFVYADRGGNIYFLHNSKSPRRSKGWDWKKYLPGDRRDLVWQEQIAFAEMPQLANPKSGFLLSANQTPFNVTVPADNLDPNDFPVEHGYQNRMTNRADQGLALMGHPRKISEAEFISVKWDKTYHPNSRARKYVNSILEHTFTPNSERSHGQDLIAQWDGTARLDSREAPIAICLLSEEWMSEQHQEPAPEILGVFDKCIEDLKDSFGRIDPEWRVVNRLRRGDVDLPIGGGPDTLRAVYGLPDPDGRLRTVAGDGLIFYVSWDKEGKQSAYSVHNYGSASTRPSSPHYADQTGLFTSETFRPVQISRESVLARPHHIYQLPQP
ncbi:acylase [Alphaproteobacteria bacterium]|nr:acylase [Alphaproteobacteria bacterium]